VVNALTALPNDVVTINWHAAGVGMLSLAICFWWPKRLTRILPSPLLALIICTTLTFFIADVPLLGEVPSGFPSLQIPQIDFEQLSYMLVGAAILAALGSIDSLLTSLVADNITRSFHDSDKELVGQGIGNLVA
jgi:SulP family sulfate permease